MKLKKTVSAVLAGAMLLGTSAFAKDNIYAYNKFISTVIGPQVGYCDFAASFAGHENEYDNVMNLLLLRAAVYRFIKAAKTVLRSLAR